MILSNAISPPHPVRDEVLPLSRRIALLLSFEAAIADRTGTVSAASRFKLMRLFQAFGGAVALATNQDLCVTARELGMPHIAVIGGASSPQDLRAQLDQLMQTPPFHGRQLVVCGAATVPAPLSEHVLNTGGVFADHGTVYATVDAWLEQFAPMPFAMRAHA